MACERGFTLIELVIALFLSTLLAGVLYAALAATLRTVKRLEQRADEIAQTVPLYNQLEKDISAAFVPFIQKEESSQLPTQSQNQPQQAPQKIEVDQKKEEHPKKWFVATSGESGMQELTFITTTTLRGYDQITPHCVRVIYRVENRSAGLFALTRQEFVGAQLIETFEKNREKGSRVYDLIGSIMELKVTFFAKKEEKNKEQKIEYETFATWNSDEREKSQKSLIPDFVEFEGKIKDQKQDSVRTFVYRFACIVPAIYEKTQEPQKQTKEAPQKQNATQPAPVPQPQKTTVSVSQQPIGVQPQKPSQVPQSQQKAVTLQPTFVR